MSKPDDIPQDVWDKASDVLTDVTNDNHCWGIFDAAPEGYANDLHTAFARAIMTAKAEAYEDAAKIAEKERRSDLAVKHGYKPTWLVVQEEISQAIRSKANRRST